MEGRSGASLLLQVFGVLFAVLVALGVDEAWQAKENRELGEDAASWVLDEIYANRSELQEAHEENSVLLEAVAAAAHSTEDSDLSVEYGVAILSSSAWEAAGLTSAVRFMEFQRVSRFSRLYKLQELYENQQQGVLDAMSELSGGGPTSSQSAGLRLLGPLAISGSLEEGLIAAYDSVLVESGRAPDQP